MFFRIDPAFGFGDVDSSPGQDDFGEKPTHRIDLERVGSSRCEYESAIADPAWEVRLTSRAEVNPTFETRLDSLFCGDFLAGLRVP